MRYIVLGALCRAPNVLLILVLDSLVIAKEPTPAILAITLLGDIVDNVGMDFDTLDNFGGHVMPPF